MPEIVAHQPSTDPLPFSQPMTSRSITGYREDTYSIVLRGVGSGTMRPPACVAPLFVATSYVVPFLAGHSAVRAIARIRGDTAKNGDSVRRLIQRGWALCPPLWAAAAYALCDHRDGACQPAGRHSKRVAGACNNAGAHGRGWRVHTGGWHRTIRRHTVAIEIGSVIYRSRGNSGGES